MQSRSFHAVERTRHYRQMNKNETRAKRTELLTVFDCLLYIQICRIFFRGEGATLECTASTGVKWADENNFQPLLRTLFRARGKQP